MNCRDHSTLIEPEIRDALNPLDISSLGVAMLAELLSEIALKDESIKGRLRELVASVDRSKSRFKKPFATNVLGSLSCEYMPEASPALAFIFDTIRGYAISRAPVMITGENATVKELVARALHYGSDSRNGPFVPVSCASVPVTAIDRELFGQEKCVASKGVPKIGRIEMAAGGTIFLDAIGNLSLEAQAHLLRFLQEGTIERIGSQKPIPVTTRIIAATRVDLRKAVANRQFRGDLLHRLDGLTLHLPPFQDRDHDILLMAKFLLQQFADRIGGENLAMGVEREQHIPWTTAPGFASPSPQGAMLLSQGLAGTRASVEAALIRATLRRNRYNIKQSAKEMGISRVTLYRAIHRHGIALERSRVRSTGSDGVSACHPCSEP